MNPILLAAKSALREDDKIADLLDCSEFQSRLALPVTVTGIEVPLKGLATSRQMQGAYLEKGWRIGKPPKAHTRQRGPARSTLTVTICRPLCISTSGRLQPGRLLRILSRPARRLSAVPKRQAVALGEFTTIGRQRYQSALQRHRQCLESNTWPDYEGWYNRSGLRLDDYGTGKSPHALILCLKKKIYAPINAKQVETKLASLSNCPECRFGRRSEHQTKLDISTSQRAPRTGQTDKLIASRKTYWNWIELSQRRTAVQCSSVLAAIR